MCMVYCSPCSSVRHGARPMIEITDEDGTVHHAGISHAEKEGMVSMQQDDVEEPNSFDVGDGAYAGLSNKSQLQIQHGDLGNTTEDLDKKILDANPKLRDKTTKRNKK